MHSKKLATSSITAVIVIVALFLTGCQSGVDVVEIEKEVKIEVEKVVEVEVQKEGKISDEPEYSYKLEEAGDIGEVEVSGDSSAADACGFDVVIGSNGDGKIVNPILAVDTDGFWRTDMMFDSLVDLDLATLVPIPHLATSWEVSDDGTTYTFNLTDADVRWHDGEAFSVDDIEYTMMEILKPTYTGIYQQRFADLVGADKVIAGDATELDGFQVLDDSTIQFTLNKPNAAFLAVAINDFKFLPKHLLEGQEITEDMPFSLAPVGTGPYKFVEWDKGNRFVMEWNLDYWGEAPCPKTITVVVIPDMMALAAAVETGDIDLTDMIPPTEVARLASLEHLAYYKQPSVGSETLWFNLTHPILQDLRVRQAIGHAIDVLAFTEGVLQGTTDPANQHISNASWAWDPDATVPEYNPEKAKELLAEAGYADGFKIKLSTNQGNFFREHFVEYAQAELAKVGIEVEIEKQEWGTFIGGVIDGNYEMRFHNQTGGVPDPDVIYEIYKTGGSSNWSFYSNADVDKWLDATRLTSDIDERKALFYQITEQLNKDMPGFYAFWRPNPLVTQAHFSNVVPSLASRYGTAYHIRMGAAPAAAAEGEVTLVVAVADDIQTIDTCCTNFIRGNQAEYHIYEMAVNHPTVETASGALVGDTDFTKLEGMYYESWERVGDGTDILVKVRDGITFADGGQMDAEDAVYVLNRAFGTTAGMHWLVDSIMSMDEEAEVVSEMEFIIHTSRPNPLTIPALYMSGSAGLDSEVVKSHATDDDPWAQEWMPKNVAGGSGPFILESRKPDEEVVFRARPDYWQGKSQIDKLIWKVVPEPATRLALLLKGDVDVVEGLTTDELLALEGAEGVKVVTVPSKNMVSIIMNSNVGPTTDVRVRQAISYAVDYEDIVSQVYNNGAQRLWGPLPTGSAYSLPDLWKYDRDLDKAKALLADAGYADGLDITLSMSSARAEHELIAVRVQNHLKEVGINVTIEKLQSSVFAEKKTANEIEVFIDEMLAWIDDPNYVLSLVLQCGVFGNYGAYCNERVDEIIENGWTELDLEKRHAMFAEAQALIVDEAPWVFLTQPDFHLAMRDNVHGYIHYLNEIVRYYSFYKS